MKNWWLKFGCFLIGYNYNILSVSSEVSAKAVKRYTSAMLIVCILWSFVGFVFTQRYLKADLLGSIFGAIVLCIIIIQVERQIILTVHKNKWLFIFRGLIAFTMALIGSVIIDQIVLKEDIEQKKIFLLDAKVNAILPAKQADLKSQIAQLDTVINNKENERRGIMDDISKHPIIKNVTSQINSVPISNSFTDSTKQTTIKTKLVPTTSYTINSVTNPKITLLQPLVKQIESLRVEKTKKDNLLLSLRPMVENEINSKIGFLDELKVMFALISDSTIALVVWLLWILFLLGIESFIMISMISKGIDQQTDYDLTILHQMDLQKKKLLLLARTAEAKTPVY